MHLIKEWHLNTQHKGDAIFINTKRKYSKVTELGDIDISWHYLVKFECMDFAS